MNVKTIYSIINIPRLFPAYGLTMIKKDARFDADMTRWCEWKNIKSKCNLINFCHLMLFFPEFRNICYYRLGKLHYLIKWLCRPIDTLYIHCSDIGGGFLVQHGFATIINADKIGQNFKIFQQVTIGYNGEKRPIIGDNVEVCCGAKVIGGVHVGNNVLVGAQTLVIRDVEDNVIVGGVPAKVLRRIEQ